MDPHIPLDDRHLIYHPEADTEHGVMPPFYIEVPASQLADALAAGGIDVSDSPADRRAYQRQVDAYYQCGMGVA